MPLRAVTTGGDEIVAPLLDGAAWDDLVARVRGGEVELRMPCCDAVARPRVSPLGTCHFFHQRRGDCDWKPETAEHLAIKAKVIELFSRRGWVARPEVSGEAWRADVLASDGDRHVVVEVQLSPQDAETTRQRTARYRDAGLRSVWLMRRLPPGLRSDATVSAFELRSDRPPYSVDVDGQWVPLGEFLDACIDRRLRFRRAEIVPRALVRVHRETLECHSCGRFFSVATGSFERRCCCGSSQPVPFNVTVEAAIDRLVGEAIAAGDAPAGVSLAAASPEVAARLAPNQSTMRGVAAPCPKCGKPCGLAFNRAYGPGDAAIAGEVDLPVQPVPVEWPRHWCLRRRGDGH